MFTYVKAKNFKSLKNINISFNRTKLDTNNLIIIYGENGSGKTNIVELFKVLQLLIKARDKDVIINKLSQDILNQQVNTNEFNKKMSTELYQVVRQNIDLKEYKTIDEKELVEIEYGFKIDDVDGYYYIKFNDAIIHEKLYFTVNKQKSVLFEIKKDNNTNDDTNSNPNDNKKECKDTSNNDKIKKFLNTRIFINKKYNDELLDIVDKYWGKYSFLSLLNHELSDKNINYVYSNISYNVFKVINEFLSTTIHINKESLDTGNDEINLYKKLPDIQKGIIPKSENKILQIYEEALNIFFTQSYADIKELKYKLVKKEHDIEYELYFKKMVAGKLISIPSELESSGTKKVLNQFDSLIGSLFGENVIIDEIDNGIHDLLMRNIIISLKKYISGQLIITTHNTLLLEVLPKENIYIISSDSSGEKEICSLKDFGIHLQRNNNLRDLYLKGMFGGIPMASYIDFEDIKYTLKETANQTIINKDTILSEVNNV